MQTIFPYLLYDDAAAGMDFLSHAFGFTETMRSEDGGRIAHAQLRLGDAEVMLGQPQGKLDRTGDQTVLMYVYVDDVNAHFQQARDGGAEILEEPTDQEYGDRHYHTRDPEGHSWYFAQRVGSNG